MRHEVLDVLEEHDRRSRVAHEVPDREEQVAADHIVEAMWPAEAVLLRHSRDAEGLAGESRSQHLVVADRGRVDRANVVVFEGTEVGLIGLAGVRVVLHRVDAPPSGAFQTQADPADPGEQIDEREMGTIRRVGASRVHGAAIRIDYHLAPPCTRRAWDRMPSQGSRLHARRMTGPRARLSVTIQPGYQAPTQDSTVRLTRWPGIPAR